MRKLLRRIVEHRYSAVLWTLLILGLCTIPGFDLPPIKIISIDKFVHLTLFAVFGYLWIHRLPLSTRRRLAWVAAAGVLYAVGTEWYQGWLGWGRIPDPMDAVANTAGLLTGMGIYLWENSVSSRKERDDTTLGNGSRDAES